MTAYESRRFLQQLGTKLELRIASMSHESQFLPSYSATEEAEYRDEVDTLCQEIALRSPVSADAALAGLGSSSLGFQELILRRVRDAQRGLRENGSLGLKPGVRLSDAIAHLLVDGWHAYAEPYWLERMAQEGEHQQVTVG